MTFKDLNRKVCDVLKKPTPPKKILTIQKVLVKIVILHKQLFKFHSETHQ